MVNLNPLDALDTLDSYRQLFMDARFWQPYVRQVCVRHSLSCSTIRAGTPGTCPVFIVDDRASQSPRSSEGPDFGDRWVVKFYGRLFGGARAAAAERAVGRLLALHPVAPCATLVAEGRLLAESSSSWDWPYLVFQFLDGTSFGENFGVLLKAEKMGVARQMGTWNTSWQPSIWTCSTATGRCWRFSSARVSSLPRPIFLAVRWLIACCTSSTCLRHLPGIFGRPDWLIWRMSFGRSKLRANPHPTSARKPRRRWGQT